MMTRKIIKKILPNALPMAVIIITATSPYQAFADGSDDASTEKKVSSSGKNKKSSKADKTDKDALSLGDDAVQSQKSGAVGARIKELVYNESNVYVIRTKYGYQTNIVFDPKEDIQTISVGDRSLWQIIPAGNRLFVRPMTDDITTNMTLLTNKRSYEFELKSVSEKNESNVYVVRFSYPDKRDVAMPEPYGDFAPEQLKASGEAAPVQGVSSKEEHILKVPASSTSGKLTQTISDTPASPASIGILPIHFNYSYTYAGPDSIAPLQVYDDGKTTFVKYKSIGKVAPSAFIIGANGNESNATATVKDSSLVIEGVAGELALRSSDGEIRVYNESLNPR